MEGSKKQSNSMGGVLTNAPLFIAAAHELKSPLALVRQLSLGIEAGDMSPAQIERMARQITLTSERALRLTTDLTRSARLEDSLFSLEPLNPASLCREVVEEISPLYAAQGRVVKFASRRRSLLGVANRDLLRRIVLNFVDNALQYGGDKTPVVLSTTVLEGGAKIRLGVRDYGPAVSASIAKNIGSAPGVLHNRPESSGLGIYIARQFAEAMNAQIGTTRHRDGATFYVDIGTSTQMRLL